ncbi:hypothetical protein [Streptomyces cucumeris]|uniref:hypothetical protein n=1 Tax=Streptomyces cucumeris TaxID=2962890 RepID=UPI003EB6B740
MAARRPHRRTTATLALAAVALTVPLAVGCSAVEKAFDCAQLAVDISNDVDKLQKAVSGVASDPTQANEAVDSLDKDIDKLDDRTDNADVKKAVNHLQTAVHNVKKDLDKGNTPDMTAVKEATSELTKECSP